jgi:hypothetical protein
VQADDSPQHVTTQYFVPLKDALPRARICVVVLYVLGLAMLAVPTIEVFARVARLSSR